MPEHQKYRITDRIDAGGMAEVFRGVAESLQGFKKNVAIKRILPHLCKNKKFISMFLDEARLSLHLQHANIVGVFDIGVSPADQKGEGGAYFIVMEFVDGTHLKGIIESLRRQGKSLTIPQILYLTMEVCKGLAYAHDITDQETGRPLGIVHRDISPPNILISKNGEVKLVDFGLAKATSQIESTDPGVVKGKFSYLSPEAANGREVDRRADIFAVGILMYEMLTGKRLFYGETDYQTVELVRQARVPSISQQHPDVEPELEGIVRKALARDVNSRYQTAGELQDAVAQYLFSRGMKVTSRDIAQLVRTCVAEREKSLPQLPTAKNLIGTLISEELIKFTSLEELPEDTSGPGARPLSPDELSGKSTTVGPLVDTQNWAGEFDDFAPPAPLATKTPATRNGQSSAAGSSDPRGPGGARPPGTPAQAFAHPGGAAPTGKTGNSGANFRAAPPRQPAAAAAGSAGSTPTPPVEVESLEDLLEGDARRKTGPTAGGPSTGKIPPVAAVLVAVFALLLAGGGAVLWFVASHH